MSGTADWTDTNNTLNNTVKHNTLSKQMNEDKEVEILNFKTQFYNLKKNTEL